MSTALKSLADKWSGWKQSSLNRAALSATFTVALLMLFPKAILAAKDLLVANRFGTGDEIDAFLIAYLIPSFAINLAASSLAAALIPVYVRTKQQKGIAAAQQFFSRIMIGAGTVLSVLTLTLALIGSDLMPILAAGFGEEKLSLTRILFFLLIPAVAIGVSSAALSALLNANDRIFLTVLTPAITPVVIMAGIGFAFVGPTIYTLAIATLCGLVAELAVLLWAVFRYGLKPARPVSNRDPAVREFYTGAKPILFGVLLMGGLELVDQSMAAMLTAGSVSVLNYGGKAVSVILGVASAAIGVVMLPQFAKLTAAENWIDILRMFRAYSNFILISTIPVVSIGIAYSDDIVRVLFERGAFSPEDTRLVGDVQSFYFLQIPFYLLGILGAKLLIALGRNSALIWIAASNLLVDIIANYLLMHLFGVAGIALATSLVYLLSSSGILVYVKVSLGRRTDAKKRQQT